MLIPHVKPGHFTFIVLYWYQEQDVADKKEGSDGIDDVRPVNSNPEEQKDADENVISIPLDQPESFIQVGLCV